MARELFVYQRHVKATLLLRLFVAPMTAEFASPRATGRTVYTRDIAAHLPRAARPRLVPMRLLLTDTFLVVKDIL